MGKRSHFTRRCAKDIDDGVNVIWSLSCSSGWYTRLTVSERGGRTFSAGFKPQFKTVRVFGDRGGVRGVMSHSVLPLGFGFERSHAGR